MENQKMKLKGGAVDRGRPYEQRMATILSIKCALDPQLSNFSIVSNINGVGDFDDIVLLTEDHSGLKKMYCVQLKHIDKNRLQAIQLEAEKGDFSLWKYSKTYQEIKENFHKNSIFEGIAMKDLYLVLYTNAHLTGTDKAKSIHIKNVTGLDLLNTSANSDGVLQILNSDTSKNPMEQDYLNQFYLFVNQASATVTDALIRNELLCHFKNISNTVITTITDYFTKWSLGKRGMITLITKKDIQLKLMEYLLLPHSIEPGRFMEEKYVSTMLNNTLSHFNITPITEKKLLRNVFNSTKTTLEEALGISLDFGYSWDVNLTDQQLEVLLTTGATKNQQLVKKSLIEKQHFVPYLTVKDLYLSAWQCHLVPLVINCNAPQHCIENILVTLKEVASQLSFILLNPSNVNDLVNHLKMFNNFNDITDGGLRDSNLEKMCISLQGKPVVKLEEFRAKKDILDQVTPDVYVLLLNEVVQIGNTIEVEDYYIKRDLRRPLIHIDVLNNNNTQFSNSDLFMLVEYDSSIPEKYKSYTTTSKEDINSDEAYILTTTLPHADGNTIETVTLLSSENRKPVHVMKLLPNTPHLEWIYSKGSVETLQDYLVESVEGIINIVSEDNLLRHTKSKTNIISASAGMGKTFMLNSIANRCLSTDWVCYINLSEHSSKISRDQTFQEFTSHVFQNQTRKGKKILQNFCEKLYQDCVKSGSIVWLMDGYDEVASDDILTFLRDVRNRGINTWITTRPTYKKELEMQMETLSMEITHFTEDNHTMFIWKYYESFRDYYKYDESQIRYIIATIRKCSSTLDRTFVGIPLQTRMFAEIFGDDINQITEKERLTVVDLYNKFVDIKLKEYKSYEAFSLKKTLSKLALKLFFTEQRLDDLLDFDDLAKEALAFQESYKKDSIVIGLNEKGDPVFGHRSFAEFLAAYWLAREIINKKGYYNQSWVPLVDKLFYIEMIPVRIFFDRILSQNLPLNLAVLNNDLDTVRVVLKEQRRPLDKLGRSALHLAVSYGKYYDLYVSSKVWGLRNVGLHSVVRESPGKFNAKIPILGAQYELSQEIVEELIKAGFLNSTDGLFKYDAFDYAMKSCSLGAVHSLYKHFQKDELLFEEDFSVKIFLYCAVYDNLHMILSHRTQYDFNPGAQDEIRAMFRENNFEILKIKYNDMYLTELAALNGGKETIFELLQSKALSLTQGNLVHMACFNGHTQVMDLLLTLGASVDATDGIGWSPLYHSGKRGRTDVTYNFLSDRKLRSKLESTEATSMTPLHYACQGGYRDCVKMLIARGAKVHRKDAFGHTPLMYACIYGHADLITPLIIALAMQKLLDNSIHCMLNVTASHGYADCVRALLKCRLNVNNVDQDGDTPLILASKKGFSKVIEELAASQYCDLNLMKTNESLHTLVAWAQKSDHVNLSIKLLHLMVGRDGKSPGGVSALHFAACHGHPDCARALVNLGADLNIEDKVVGLEYTPLVWACMYGQDKVVEELLKLGDDTDGWLALIWASMLGYERCVGLLLDSGIGKGGKVLSFQHPKVQSIVSSEFGFDIRVVNENANVPLLLAAKNGRPNVIEVISRKGYDLGEGLNEALHWAARTDLTGETVKKLVEEGADENVANKKSLRVIPIVWACMYGRTEVVRYFLSGKTKSYLENKDLHLALNWAALGGFHECVKMLLDFGLDVDNIDEQMNNNTPLISACEYRGTLEVVDELLSRNCTVDRQNSNGLTALDFAAKNKKYDLVKRLLDTGAFDSDVDRNSELYENLQKGLAWAVKNKDNDFIRKLVQLGVQWSSTNI